MASRLRHHLLQLGLCLSLLLGQPCQADPMTLLTLEEPPLSYHNSQGELDGISVEVVRELQQRLGNTDPIQVYPWIRAYRIAQSRPDVVLFTATRSPEREPLFHWITLINRNAWVLYARRSDNLTISSLADARSVDSIGVLRGGAHQQLLSSLAFSNLIPMESYTQLLQNLAKGRINLAFYSASGFLATASTAGIDQQSIAPLFTLQTPESYIVLSKQGTDPATVQQWRDAAVAIKADGTFERIARRWVDRLQQEKGFNAHYQEGALNLWKAPD
ncbi:MAG: ABC transporter substrate-binding protein [Halopseudomonas sp.]